MTASAPAWARVRPSERAAVVVAAEGEGEVAAPVEAVVAEVVAEEAGAAVPAPGAAGEGAAVVVVAPAVVVAEEAVAVGEVVAGAAPVG
ncbi:hypothetical protein ACFWUT_25890 [Streptomyces cyaneofuscatus]|uniref:hypothetical protein n=1 Tax=Streptomyces cyaneofuscatus TaxID=66883 RepID=UPI00365D007A